MSKSKEIKNTDGRRNNSRKKSIPLKKLPEIERSNKPAINKAKKSRKKAYAKKAVKNIFGGEVEFFESIAKQAKKGSYNHQKLLSDMMYEGEGVEENKSVKPPTIVFINNDDKTKKHEDKTIDITHEEHGDK